MPMRLQTDWQVGDIALCITPGSDMEGLEVVILSQPIWDRGKRAVVYLVDPGIPLPETDKPCIGWGAEQRHLVPLPAETDPTLH